MSDSSEEEDLARFRDVVDNSFAINAKNPNKISQIEIKQLKSERYLEEASHYNDVKVPDEMAKKIGAKVSAIIERNVQFVDVEPKLPKKRKIKGGVRLFKDSEELLSWKDAKDTVTPKHNEEAKKLKISKSRKTNDDQELDEQDKVKASAVSPEFVLSKEETKCWKSRRKEKLFKYKQHNNNKELVAIE